MPPRYAYWTILIDDTPTAFRATEQSELLPTLNQLKRTNKDVVMKWFAKGRIWDSQEDARRPVQPRAEGERRGMEWRPGGQHQDPRARFSKPEQKKRREMREARNENPSAERPRGGDRPWQKPWQKKPDQPWRPPSDRPARGANDAPPPPASAHGRPPRDDRPREKRPWQEKPLQGKGGWKPKPSGGPGGAWKHSRPDGHGRPDRPQGGTKSGRSLDASPTAGWRPRRSVDAPTCARRRRQRRWQNRRLAAQVQAGWRSPRYLEVASAGRPWSPRREAVSGPRGATGKRTPGTEAVGKEETAGPGLNRPTDRR